MHKLVHKFVISKMTKIININGNIVSLNFKMMNKIKNINLIKNTQYKF